MVTQITDVSPDPGENCFCNVLYVPTFPVTHFSILKTHATTRGAARDFKPYLNVWWSYRLNYFYVIFYYFIVSVCVKHESEPHRVQRTSIWTTIQVNQNWFFVIFDTDFWPIVGRDVGALTHSRIIPNSRRHVQFSHLRFSKHLPKLFNPVFALRLGRSRSTRPKYQSSKPQWISVCVCNCVCVLLCITYQFTLHGWRRHLDWSCSSTGSCRLIGQQQQLQLLWLN